MCLSNDNTNKVVPSKKVTNQAPAKGVDAKKAQVATEPRCKVCSDSGEWKNGHGCPACRAERM
ncbi:MAG: hypothetical protein ACNFW9_02035 [Candidatus Kerfeldbacteria bacterium]